ncbi:transposable element Tcb2 transposase [Trichonephila clavipes]|nr:transposable element Tcb2 transposase [Trichonephila clavipes]
MKSSCNPQLLHHLLDVRKDSLPNSKLVLSENGRGVSDFRLTLYKRSVDSRLRVEHQLLYFTRVIVSNRVNEITSLTDPHSWYYCAGKENPAYFLSRGLSADYLVSNSKWRTGAEFLSDSEFPKKFQQVVPELDYLTELEKETVVQKRKKLPEADRSEETVLLNSDSSSILDELLELSNNYFKGINILSYIFRFNYNCRNKSKKVGPLTVAEFKESEIKLIKHAQRSLFDKKEIPSSISNLFPFVDGEGIIRVGGRLENASVPYLHKHPAILPKGSKLSKLYFNSLHTRLFHVGPQGLLNAVRQKFWPLSGRSIARKTVHQCRGNIKSTDSPLSSDADNFDVLTPGHFLIGRPITSIPEPNLIDANENRLSRWEKITKVAQRTWKKWKSDYLNTLQARSKWITGKNNLMIGQMVLIKEDFLPINTWPLGRISEVYHGSDGKTTSGCFYPRLNHWVVGGSSQCDKCGCRVWNCSQHRFTTLETISNYRIKTISIIRWFSSGRPRGTTPADDRYIVLQAKRNRQQTAGEIARHTTQVTGRPISRFAVIRRLHGGGLFARRPVRCVPLTPAHRRRRSLWCREHRNWRYNEWGRVLFTDESRLSLSSYFHRILIWRKRGSRNHPSNIIERDRYGGCGVLVWGGIMLGSRTDLHIFDAGSVNGTRYCNEILLPYVRLFRGAMGLQFLFMDDNAPCHHTVAAEQLLESEDIERMDWPARSPDLNPIEHVWVF